MRAIAVAAVLFFASPTAAQDLDALFQQGTAAVEAAGKAEEDRRHELLDEAIAAFREMLVADPGLVRVRLELARAFYLKGEDRLARRHFEHVLAGNVPAPVAANVRRFLAEIRARRRWTARFGFSLAPDTNIGAGSDERIIYIDVGGVRLPFTRDAEELTTSGIGLSVWTGGEYQYPPLAAVAPPHRRRRLAARVRRQPLRPDLRVGPCGAPLAGRQEHRGERPGERTAALERHRAGPRRPGRPFRGGAPVHPPRDREPWDVVARSQLPDTGSPRRPGRGCFLERVGGGEPHRAGLCGGRLGTGGAEAGAPAP